MRVVEKNPISSYLSNQFEKVTGVTPTEFKRTIDKIFKCLMNLYLSICLNANLIIYLCGKTHLYETRNILYKS